MEFQVWAEKYRPNKLSDVINQRHVIERIKAFVKDKNIPHMLFAGPAGTGKTTTALAMAKELYGNSWRQNILELNASDERGIDVIRGKVKDFARIKSLGEIPWKMIILDEADALTQDAQQALRRTMENYTNVTRFILLANYSSKIIEPIQSRCAVFRFKVLDETDIRKYVERIVDGERLKIDEKAINAIIYLSEGDLRKVSNLLQASAAMKEKITEDVVYDVASKAKPTDVKEMLELALKGRFLDARKKLQDMLLRQGLSGSDIISEIHRQIYSLDGISEDKKVQLIEKCGEFEFRISEGGNELIQLESLLAQFLLFKSK
ncbi:MAG: replication factor C small subunit [Candidatus Aenigmatarchaeota archaeon]|nr:replication factor C small subunit [Candidatus Aenigmarchaeota archaeon]